MENSIKIINIVTFAFLLDSVKMEYEDVATVKFGKELTKEERKKVEEFIEEFGLLTDIEWTKERTD